MSNPIKSLLPTPLSMQLISHINALSKLPLPLFRFFIDSAFCIRSSTISNKDQQFLASVLKRQKVCTQLGHQAINAVKALERVGIRILKLMKTSQPEQIQSNMENCIKYISSVLSENTLINQAQLNYLVQKLSSFINKFLHSTNSQVNTKAGVVQWSIYNLKKANINVSSQINDRKATQKGNQKQNSSQIINVHESNLKTVNKLYVKVSFDENFDYSQIQNLIGSGFSTNSSGNVQAKLQNVQSTKNNIRQNILSNITKEKSKTVTMSLIDFKIFMEQIQKIKNFNS